MLDYAFDIDVRDSSLMRGAATLRLAVPPCPRGACAAPGLALDLIGRMPGSRFGMAVDSVLATPDVGGGALVPLRWRHAADRLTIDMPTAPAVAAPSAPGAAGSAVWRVRIVYHGQPADGLIRSTDAAGRTAYFGDNWPERARHYLPTRDHPSDKATVTWSVTAPAALGVVANGRFEARACAGDVCRTRYRADVPISTKVMVFGAAPFAVETAGEVVGGGGRRVPVESWVFADERAAGFREYASAVPIVAFFDSLLAPYPFEKLANVQSRTRFGGMENAGAIFYNARSARGDGSQEGLLAHEIAHQWFGNWATEASWSHLWLSEGFATYLAHVWAAHRRGDAALRTGMAADRATVAAFLARTRVPVVDTVRTEPLEMLDANVYPRGAWVLHLLRERAGERVFWNALRRYLLRHGGRTAVTADLQAAFEAESGEDYGTFFAQWTRRSEIPAIAAAWRYDAAAREVVVTLRQSQPGGAFAFPLDIGLVGVGGAAQVARVDVDASAHTFRLPAASRPARLVLDPGVRMLFSGGEVAEQP